MIEFPFVFGSIATVLVFLLCSSYTLAQTECDEGKCTRLFPATQYTRFNECYAPDGLWGCTCEDGYRAIVLEDDVESPPFKNDFVHYTCCRSDDVALNKASEYCGGYSPVENESDYDGCVVDGKCGDAYGACLVRAGEKCSCFSGYSAKLTGRTRAMFEDELNGVIIFYEYACCPLENGANADEVEVYAPGACGIECLLADTCFEDLGCFIPDNANEFNGCVSNMCESTSGLLHTDCIVAPGEACLCANGLIAKPTGRTKENSKILEYVCCPPGTPGTEKGEACNSTSPFRYIYFMLAFDSCILILLAIQSYRQRNTENSTAKGHKAHKQEKESESIKRVDSINEHSNTFHAPKSTDNQNLQNELICLKEKMQHLIMEVDQRLNLCSLDDGDQSHEITHRETKPDSIIDMNGGHKECVAKNCFETDLSGKTENKGDDDTDLKTNLTEAEIFVANESHEKDLNENISIQEGNIIKSEMLCAATEKLRNDIKDENAENQIQSSVPNTSRKLNDIHVSNFQPKNKELGIADKTNAKYSLADDNSVGPQLKIIEHSENIILHETIPSKTNLLDSFVSGFESEELHVNDEDDEEAKFKMQGIEHDPNASVNTDGDESLFRGLISTFSREKTGGIHEFFLHYATKIPKAYRRNSFHSVAIILSPLLSWAVLVFQLLILYLILLETQYPKCSTSGGCGDGSFCDDDTGFCIEIDPNEPCSKMVTLSPLPVVSLLGSIFIYLYIIHGAIQDLEKNVRLDKAATFRYNCIKSRHHLLARWWIKAHIWGLYYVRGYMLPALVFGASMAIFYAEDDGFMVAKVVLNGVAIMFICEFDTILYDLVVTYRTQCGISEEMESALTEEVRMATVRQTNDINFLTKEDRYLHMWWLHRFMCFSMATMSLIIIQNPLKLGLFFIGNANCDMLLYLSIPLFVIAVCFAAFDNFIKGLRSWKVALANFFFGQAFLFVWIFIVIIPLASNLNGHAKSTEPSIFVLLNILF